MRVWEINGSNFPERKADAQASATLNNRGVLNLLQGDLDQAEINFKKAQSLGSAEAGANLKEVSKKRKDNAIFGNRWTTSEQTVQ